MSEKIKNSSLSKKIVSFIDKILIVDMSKLFFLIIFSYSLGYIFKISAGLEYIWITKINFFNLLHFLLILGAGAAVAYMLKKNIIRYNNKGLIIFIIFNIFIVIYSSITLGINCSILYLSYALFFTSIFILPLYCEARASFENKKKYDLINKSVALTLMLIAVFLHLLFDLKDPLLPVVLLCSFPFYIIPLFINKIEGIFLQYRTSFFIYLFFISTTIYPFLFIASIVFFFISKFYFFVKYDIKYPTFIKKYDISR
jgi:hypothetical protein